jgi:hypothetical protein
MVLHVHACQLKGPPPPHRPPPPRADDYWRTYGSTEGGPGGGSPALRVVMDPGVRLAYNAGDQRQVGRPGAFPF